MLVVTLDMGLLELTLMMILLEAGVVDMEAVVKVILMAVVVRHLHEPAIMPATSLQAIQLALSYI